VTGSRWKRSFRFGTRELDESLAEAHASLAWTLIIYDWDWAGAAREFRRSIELDSRYATAHQWYAFLLSTQGRLEEALVEAHTAQELDPASVSIRRALGYVYVYARRYGHARYHLTRAIGMNPAAEETYRVLGLTLALQGQLDEAERVLREAIGFPSAGTYTQVTLAYAPARNGKREYAESLLEELEARRWTGRRSPSKNGAAGWPISTSTRWSIHCATTRASRSWWKEWGSRSRPTGCGHILVLCQSNTSLTPPAG
jgi:tetratricopeptide (TPR) repeat protein